MIEDAGFEVVDVGSAAAALLVLDRRPDVRIVFTDVAMPGDVDGIALAAAVQDRRPPVAVIITSGKPWPAGMRLPDGVLFFSKPYRQDRVIAAIRRMAV
jgi:DNA-binding NtrC family response regulator